MQHATINFTTLPQLFIWKHSVQKHKMYSTIACLTNARRNASDKDNLTRRVRTTRATHKSLDHYSLLLLAPLAVAAAMVSRHRLFIVSPGISRLVKISSKSEWRCAGKFDRASVDGCSSLPQL